MMIRSVIPDATDTVLAIGDDLGRAKFRTTAQEGLAMFPGAVGDVAPAVIDEINDDARATSGCRSMKWRPRIVPNASGSPAPSRAGSTYTVFFMVSVGRTSALLPSV